MGYNTKGRGVDIYFNLEGSGKDAKVMHSDRFLPRTTSTIGVFRKYVKGLERGGYKPLFRTVHNRKEVPAL